MSDDSLHAYSFSRTRWDRFFDALQDLTFWGFGTFVGVAVAMQLVVPDWPPPVRAQPALVLGPIVAVLMTCKRWFLQYHTISVHSDQIALRRAVGTVPVPVTEVIGLVALPGLNWNRIHGVAENEPLVTGQTLVILTERERHSLPFEHLACHEIYQALRSACPLAWGLPYPGDLEPPADEESAFNQANRTSALGRLRRFYLRRVFRQGFFGLTLLVGAVAALVAIPVGFWLGKLDHFEGSLVTLTLTLILLAGAGALFLRNSPRDIRVLTKLRRQEANYRAS